MLSGQVSFGFFWGPRAQTVSECATVAWRFLSRLKKIDKSFATWRAAASDRIGAVRSTKTLIELLLEGISYTDFDRKPMPDLGYDAWLLAGNSRASTASVSFRLGLTTPWLTNMCLVCLGANSPVWQQMKEPADALDLCRVIIDTFDPDEGRVMTDEIMDAIDNQATDPQVGFVNFNKGTSMLREPLPKGIRRHHDPERGDFALTECETLRRPSRTTIKSLLQLIEVIRERGRKNKKSGDRKGATQPAKA